MLIGVTPFYNRERKLLLLKIRQSKVVFPDKRKYKIDYSDDFVDVCLQLLNKDKSQRLGSKGDIDEVMAHPFFAKIDKEALLAETLEPPLKIEQSGDEINTRYFNSKSAPQDLAETVLPAANLEKLAKNKGKFENFESKRQV